MTICERVIPHVRNDWRFRLYGVTMVVALKSQSIWASIKTMEIFFWILKLPGTNLSQLQYVIFNKL